MKNKCKKIITGVLASALALSALSFTACGGTYSQDKLDGYQTPTAAAQDNGGFSVEYGDYVYFINGQEAYTVENKFGEVTKGALMRIKKSDLDKEITAEGYNSAEVVVPMLFVAQNFDSGIYIYGDYVYYATPTTDKNMSGTVENSWIDFKRAKLDGSDTMKGYYFRLSDNAAKYRFVEAGEGDDKAVYCLYEEDGALKSFNTETEKTTVLVSGAKGSTYYYDSNDLTNPNVYYVMGVAPDAESPNPPQAESYDQVYCVNAAASVESVSKDETSVSYKVKNGATYTFNRAYMEQKNDEAKDDGDDTTDAPYDFDDYTTFPYVNLGSLVLDGIGSANEKTQFNESKDGAPKTFEGYNYTVKSVQNGGVYFTRTEVMKTNTSGENSNLYYLADKSGEWNAINANSNVTVVALDTTNTDSAIFYIEEGVHKYLYIKETALYRVDGLAASNEVPLTKKVPSGATLWTRNGDYVYYTAAAADGTGNAISRINYKGSADKYAFLPEKAYQQETAEYLNFNASWYKPEIYGDTVLYSNVKTFGAGSAYNYVYAAKLTDITVQNEDYNKVQDYIDEYSVNADLQAAMRYYFRTGKTDAFDAAKDLYDEYQKEEFETFKSNAELKTESNFVTFIGKMTDADAEAIDEAWVNYLRTESEDETESKGLATWAIVLIVVGGVLVVAAAVLVPVLMSVAKKKEEARIADETVNAYKRPKIDTTDDKSIDVYADETEETTEETAEAEEATETVETEETTEEVAEETTETTEEVVEAPVEEATEEAVETPAEETQE